MSQIPVRAPRAPRPYAPPKIVIYGDIRTITQAVGNKGNLDGGAFGLKTDQVI